MKMTGTELLSQVVTHDKYARYLPLENRRESWDDIVDRSIDMHCRKYPAHAENIKGVFNDYVRTKLVLPSMRGLQYAGKAIELFPHRMMNCAAFPIDSVYAFRELFFLLLGGTGVGYSVQQAHINDLPSVRSPGGRMRYVVQDTIIGWCDALHALVRAYFEGRPRPIFDFSDIRPKGELLRTAGGRAPGPEGLYLSLTAIEDLLEGARGRKLTSLEVHDICCHIAKAVLSGGNRRSAMLAMFDFDDKAMRYAKRGDSIPTQRYHANNSAMALRYRINEEEFQEFMRDVYLNGAGEPGVYFANHMNSLTNPCAEASVYFNFCNLTTINFGAVASQKDLEDAAYAASVIGTLQAGYTDYVYLRDKWRERSEAESLIGVSMTGLARRDWERFDYEAAARMVSIANERTADDIGIRQAYRQTVLKPEGTSSLLLGCSSGVHAYPAQNYIRRVTMVRGEALHMTALREFPELVEDSTYNSNEAYLCVPVRAPSGDSGAIVDESPEEMLHRVGVLSRTWIKPGHRKGHNGHSISATVQYRDEAEYGKIVEWMWENRNDFNGMTVLPKFEAKGAYKHLPQEECDENRVAALEKYLPVGNTINWAPEEGDNTTREQEAACAGGYCEI